MRIKQGFVLREVAGQAVVIATGEVSKAFHGMIKLNATGADIWRGLSEGLTDAQIADRLVERYGADGEAAAADVAAFVRDAREAGFLAS